jgi:hypothetical protein
MHRPQSSAQESHLGADLVVIVRQLRNKNSNGALKRSSVKARKAFHADPKSR